MNTKQQQIFYKLFVCAVILLCIVFNIGAFAQSGRTTAVLVPASQDSAEAEIKIQGTPCGKPSEEVVYVSPKKINEFIEELNRLGGCGYRLEMAAKIPLATEDNVEKLNVFAILKLSAGDKYEYNWFAATTPGEIVTRANFQAEKGFYFRQKIMYISGRCSESTAKQKKENENLGGLGDILNLGLGKSGSVFVFERKNGIIKKNEYRVLDGAVERGEQALSRNQKVMDGYVSRGFRPVEVFYLGSFDLFAVVMEKDEQLKPEGEYRLLRQTYGMNKKLTQLSREGFEPILIGFYFAVLHRKDNQPVPVSYETAESYKEIVRKLPKWSAQGASYQVTGITDYDVGCDPYEGKLFFAVPFAGKAKKSDFKVLEMSNAVERYFKKKDKSAFWTDAPSTEKLSEFQKLLKEGYIIREVFFGYEIIILFERSLI